jgi:hypothetical protein
MPKVNTICRFTETNQKNGKDNLFVETDPTNTTITIITTVNTHMGFKK